VVGGMVLLRRKYIGPKIYFNKKGVVCYEKVGIGIFGRVCCVISTKNVSDLFNVTRG
jgi:hypothetical protein